MATMTQRHYELFADLLREARRAGDIHPECKAALARRFATLASTDNPRFKPHLFFARAEVAE